MNKIKQKGESLISVMLATAVIAGLMSVVIPSLVDLNKPNEISESFNECRNVAQSIVQKLKSNGVQAEIFNTPVGENSVYLDSRAWRSGETEFNSRKIYSEMGSASDKRWPHSKVLSWNSSQKRYNSNTALLIQGSINGLMSLYKKSPEFCSDTGKNINSTDYLKNLRPDSIKNKSVNAYLSIRPFNTKTGQLLGCSRNFNIRPPAITEPAPAVNAGMINFGNYRSDRGLEVSLKVDVTRNRNIANTRDSQIENDASCTIKTRFQYDQADVAPLAPEVTTLGSTYTIKKPAGSGVKGTHLICKENHLYYYYKKTTGFLGASRTTRHKGPLVSTDWKICDKITVCGLEADSVDLNEGRGEIVLNFPSLSKDCASSLEARTFDSSGNTSGLMPIVKPGDDNSVYIPAAVIDPPDNERPPGNRGYVVAGVEFNSLGAAQKASALSGHPMRTTSNVSNPQDGLMNATDISLDGVSAHANANLQAANSMGALADGSSNLTAGQLASGVANSSAVVADAQAAVAAAEAQVAALRNNLEIRNLSGQVIGYQMGIVGESALIKAAEELVAVQMSADVVNIQSMNLSIEALSRDVDAAQAVKDAASAALSTCRATTKRVCSSRDEDGNRDCRNVPIDCSGPSAAAAAASAALSSAQAAKAAAVSAKNAAQNAYSQRWS